MRVAVLATLVAVTAMGCGSSDVPQTAEPPTGAATTVSASNEIETTVLGSPHIESTAPAISADSTAPLMSAAPSGLQPIWYQSAVNLLDADSAYPGVDTAAVAAQSHAVVAGRVKSVEPGLVIQFPGTGVPPTAFVNLVIEADRSWTSKDGLPHNREVAISLLADYSGTQVVADVLTSARVDPSTVEDFPEEELGDVEFTYDYELIEQAYTTRIDDAITELLSGQEKFIGVEIVAFVRSYDVDLTELEQRADTDAAAAEAVAGWPDRPVGEFYLTNPLAILTADAVTGEMRSIQDGSFQDLAGRDFGRAGEALAVALRDTYRETVLR